MSICKASARDNVSMLLAATDGPLDILTGSLAVVGVITAVVAAVAAKAARQTADIAQASLAASIRPVIADVPQDLLTPSGDRDWKRRVNVERSNGALVFSVPDEHANTPDGVKQSDQRTGDYDMQTRP